MMPCRIRGSESNWNGSSHPSSSPAPATEPDLRQSFSWTAKTVWRSWKGPTTQGRINIRTRHFNSR